jgi:nucleoside-diphosphate-sugar epimerase
MAHALIGSSGFVGSTLLRQTRFDALYRSTNIADIDGRSFDTIVCAAAPAQKWLANREPAADRRNIDALIARLDKVQCRRFVLVSTVDVFKWPVGVDEDSPVDEEGLHAYGLHRRLLERFCAERFPGCLVVRLPGLVGPGLRKNAIFDFLNDNNLPAIDARGVFQFYPMVNLWTDLGLALEAGLPLVHLASEPVTVADVAREAFGREFDNRLSHPPARYDLRSRHAAVFGGQGAYAYSRRETLLAVRAYAQSEPRTLPAGASHGAPR